MRRRLLIALFLLLPTPVFAQVAITPTSSVTFISADHTTIIPAGQVNAGQPLLASYQVSLFAASADPTTGVPLAVSAVLGKAAAVLQPAPAPANTYKLTFAQTGLLPSIPACTTLPCPQYTLLIIAIGTDGKTSAKGVLSESDPFTAAVPLPNQAPAAPASVKIVP